MPLNATDAERQAQANSDLAAKIRLEAGMVRQLKSLFNTMSKDLEAFFAATGRVPDASNYSPQLTGILTTQYRRTGDVFSGRTVEFLREADDDDPTVLILTAFALANGMTFTELVDGMANEVTVQTQAFVTTNVVEDNFNITRTNQRDFDTSIVFATLALADTGILFPSRAQVAKEAKNQFKRQTASRPALIAATVTQKSAEGTKQIDNDVFFANRNRAGIVPLQREELWITRGDERVREAHVAADNTKKNANGFFVVGRESLRFPGDPNGSAGNIINCRCAAVLVIDDSDTPLIENVN